jgi:Tfp pilus assembly protein PilN
MIKINLLPPEKRKAERTPVSRFALILVDVIAAMIILAYLATIVLKIWDVESQIDIKNQELKSLQSAVEQHDRLDREQQALQAKVREIEDLTGRDIQWWEAVNALWDVIHQNPKVWIDDMKVLDDRQAQSDLKKMDASPAMKLTPTFGVSMRCHVAGNDVAEMTRFRTDLKANAVLTRALPLLNFDVDWRVEDEKDAQEKASIGFNVTLFGFKKAAATAAAAGKGAQQ